MKSGDMMRCKNLYGLKKRNLIKKEKFLIKLPSGFRLIGEVL